MTRTAYIAVVSGFLSALASACVGTDVGNGATDLDVTIFDSQSASLRTAAPEGLALTAAWVSIDRFRFRHAGPCSGGNELEVEGPVAVDLLAAGAPAPWRDLDLAGQSFCRVSVTWNEFDGAEPVELRGASLYLAGTTLAGTQFVVRSDRGDELGIDARGGSFEVPEGGLFFAFDSQRLFDGVELDDGDVQGGIVRVEDGSNDDLLEVFEANVASAAALYADQNDDGMLDSDERQDSDVLAD